MPRGPRRPKPPGRERKTADPSAGRQHPLKPRLDAETGAARVERVHDGRHFRAPGVAVDRLIERPCVVEEM